MPINKGSTLIKGGKLYLGSKRVKKVYKGAELLWSDVVDTAITITNSSKSSSNTVWPYQIDGTLYAGIDMSLYKGVRIYVSVAYISASFANTTARIYLVAGNNNIEIAGCQNYGSGTSNSSLAGTTQTILFNGDSGMTDFRIVGDGPTTCKYVYELANAVLLAR